MITVRHDCKYFTILSHLSLIITQQSRPNYDSCLTNKETEARRFYVTIPGGQSRVVFETRQSGSTVIRSLEKITTKGRKKKWKMTGKGKRLIILKKVVMECLYKKVTYEQNLEWMEKVSQARVWVMSFPNSRTSDCRSVTAKALRWVDFVRRLVRLVQRVSGTVIWDEFGEVSRATFDI